MCERFYWRLFLILKTSTSKLRPIRKQMNREIYVGGGACYIRLLRLDFTCGSNFFGCVSYCSSNVVRGFFHAGDLVACVFVTLYEKTG